MVNSIKPFSLSECVEGDGLLAGAIKLDDAFEDHLRLNTSLRLKNLDENEFNSFFTRDWEHGVKRVFTGASDPAQFALSPPLEAMRKREKMSQIMPWNKEKKEYTITRWVVKQRSLSLKTTNPNTDRSVILSGPKWSHSSTSH